MMTITINKWDEYQPRKDRANHTWFRVDNSIPFSEKLFGLDAEQRWFWICLMCFASRKQSSTFNYDQEYFIETFRVTKKKMDAALKSLEMRGAVTLSYGDSQTPDDTLRLTTDRQTDITDITDKQTVTFTSEDLLNLWSKERGVFSEVREFTASRRDKAKSQLAKYPDESHWRSVIEAWNRSDFCRQKWKPTFDDLLNESKRISTLEGKYENRQSTMEETSEQRVERMVREQKEWRDRRDKIYGVGS
ncbi:hypothetical protein CCP2SC5_1020006 [Azospirillaceae bacterium]